MIKVDFRDMPCHMIDPDMICSTVTLGTYNEVYIILYIYSIRALMIRIVLFYSNIIIYLLLVINLYSNSSCYLYYVKDTKLIPTYSPNTFSDEVIRNGGYEEVKGGSSNASATGLVEPNDEDADDAPPSEGKEVATPSSVHEDKDELTEEVDNSDTDGDDNEEEADDDKSAERLSKVNINYYLYNCVRPNINSLLYRRFLIPHR
jgi:hypothetical protein